jgi:hypothetical protein
MTAEDDSTTEIPGAGAGPAPDPGPADVVGPDLGPDREAIVRRTRDGWRVGDEDVPDLTCAMVLADLLAADLSADARPAGAASADAPDGRGADGHGADGRGANERGADERAVGSRRADGHGAGGRPAGSQAPAGRTRSTEPAAAGGVASEARRLRTTVSQLQYALTARIRIEQAIGVLAERHRIHPRQAFEQLRAAARNRGRKVIDIAADVVASATNPLLQLPDELSRPRSAGRRAVRQPRSAH